jgi:phosphoribosylaminoimidazolecarboxamide formyltransferase / IMP cyclohydrolase
MIAAHGRWPMAGNVVRKIDEFVKVERVLASVSNKAGLEKFVPGLVEVNPGIHFYSTGGTFDAIRKILGDEKAKKHLTQVSEYTGQPETQGGLVKTLDFKIYLGLLTEKYNDAHQGDLQRTNGVAIDLVIVNLYPFRETIAKPGVTVEEARANIDIGGPCMVRASAKNYLRVAPVVDPADYDRILGTLRKTGGKLDVATRFDLARKAFAHTAAYDTAIAAFLKDSADATMKGCYEFQDR